jgi:uncharacterized membrane protein
VNDHGVIVGGEGATSCDSSGFVENNGVFTPIVVPGSITTQALGINNSGQIVGSDLAGGPGDVGFLLTNGVFTTISVPGATVTTAESINDAGTIVGTFTSGILGLQSCSAGAKCGFVFDGANYTTIKFPNAHDTAVHGINNAGVK